MKEFREFCNTATSQTSVLEQQGCKKVKVTIGEASIEVPNTEKSIALIVQAICYSMLYDE